MSNPLPTLNQQLGANPQNPNNFPGHGPGPQGWGQPHGGYPNFDHNPHGGFPGHGHGHHQGHPHWDQQQGNQPQQPQQQE